MIGKIDSSFLWTPLCLSTRTKYIAYNCWIVHCRHLLRGLCLLSAWTHVEQQSQQRIKFLKQWHLRAGRSHAPRGLILPHFGSDFLYGWLRKTLKYFVTKKWATPLLEKSETFLWKPWLSPHTCISALFFCFFKLGAWKSLHVVLLCFT